MYKVIENLIEEYLYKEAEEEIRKELEKNIFNHAMYFYLGKIEEKKEKYDRAYLCYSHAENLCLNDLDKKVIADYKVNLLQRNSVSAKKTSIIMLTYNNLEYTKICLNSIRQDSDFNDYEVIVVDNASTDGTREWLKDQKDIKTIFNEKNEGFPKGCNQGIEIAQKENDIFLLNNDTVIMTNSIFNLRMALYNSQKVGATGAVSNKVVNYQQITEVFDEFEEYVDYALVNNITNEERYVKKIKLIGFAMLMKREVLNKVGYLDEIFTPGNYEDDDISFRILDAGYELLMCRDSYIHHFGSVSFSKDIGSYIKILNENEKKFVHKWGFSSQYSSCIRYDLLSFIDDDKNKKIKVLEIGCALGATLLEIKNRYPNSEVHGIELNEYAAKLANKFAKVINTNVEQADLDYEKEYFDYIILGDVLEHLVEPEKVLKKLSYYLKETGSILTSIPNVMHHSIISDLINGNWTYKDSGIMDRTHLRFFTKKEILKMFDNANYFVRDMGRISSAQTSESDETIKKIMSLGSQTDIKDYYTIQYVNKIMKKELLKKIAKLLRRIEFDVDSEEAKTEILFMIKEGILDEEFLLQNILVESADKVYALNQIAILCFENERYDMILPLLNAAYEIAPLNVDTNYNLAYILNLLGEVDLAKRYLNNLNKDDPNIEN